MYNTQYVYKGLLDLILFLLSDISSRFVTKDILRREIWKIKLDGDNCSMFCRHTKGRLPIVTRHKVVEFLRCSRKMTNANESLRRANELACARLRVFLIVQYSFSGLHTTFTLLCPSREKYLCFSFLFYRHRFTINRENTQKERNMSFF